MGARLCGESGGLVLLLGTLLAAGCSETNVPEALTTCPAGTVRAGNKCVPPSGVDGGDLPPASDASSSAPDATASDAGGAPEDGGPIVDGGVHPDASAPDSGPADTGVPEQVALPFWVDDHYVMSGKMGDLNGNVMVAPCPTDPGDPGGPCKMITWTPGAVAWVGFYFQYPENNWTRPGLAIAPGAQRVSFTVWGAVGNESLNFAAGIRGADGFQVETGYSVVSTTPTRHTIDLSAVSYGQVAGAFAWFTDNPSHAPSVTFYLDDLRWE